MADRTVSGKDPLCSFCKYGTEVEVDCGKLHQHVFPNQKQICAHHKCLQYSALLVQYEWEHFGGFKPECVLEEIKRAGRLKCCLCVKKRLKYRKNKLGGASAGCCVTTCPKSFHYYCARKDDTVITKRLVVFYKSTPTKKVLYRVFCSAVHEKQYRAMLTNGISCGMDISKKHSSNDGDNEDITFTCQTDSPASPEGAITSPFSMLNTNNTSGTQPISDVSQPIVLPQPLELNSNENASQSASFVNEDNHKSLESNTSSFLVEPKVPKRGRPRKVSEGNNNSPVAANTKKVLHASPHSGTISNGNINDFSHYPTQDSCHQPKQSYEQSLQDKQIVRKRGRPAKSPNISLSKQSYEQSVQDKQNVQKRGRPAKYQNISLSGKDVVLSSVEDKNNSCLRNNTEENNCRLSQQMRSVNSAPSYQSCSPCNMGTGSYTSSKITNALVTTSAISHSQEKEKGGENLQHVPQQDDSRRKSVPNLNSCEKVMRSECSADRSLESRSPNCFSQRSDLDTSSQEENEVIPNICDLQSQASSDECKEDKRPKLLSCKSRKDCILCFPNPAKFNSTVKRKMADELKTFYTSFKASVMFLNEVEFLDSICQNYALCLCLIKDISEYLVKADFSVLEKMFLDRRWFESQLDKYRFTTSLQEEMPLDIKKKIEATVKNRIGHNFQELHKQKGVEFGSIDVVDDCEVMSLFLNNTSDCQGLIREAVVKELPEIHELTDGVKLKSYSSINGSELHYLTDEEFSILSNWLRLVIDQISVHRINLPDDKVLICRSSPYMCVNRLSEGLHEILMNDKWKLSRADCIIICVRNVDKNVVKYEKYCCKVLETYINRHMDKSKLYFMFDTGSEITELRDFLPESLIGIVTVYCARDPNCDPISCVIVQVNNPAEACLKLKLYSCEKEINTSTPKVQYVRDGQIPSTSRQPSKRKSNAACFGRAGAKRGKNANTPSRN